MSEPKQIATLPPLEELQRAVPRSPRTGEPVRPALVGVAAVLLYLAVAAAAAVYGWHWWLAAHPESYPTSAWLVEWTGPKPGTWLSLTMESVLAAALAAAAGAAGVAGFQAWNGWKWSRWAGLVAVLLMGGFAAVTSWWGLIPAGLSVVGVGAADAAARIALLPAVAAGARGTHRPVPPSQRDPLRPPGPFPLTLGSPHATHPAQLRAVPAAPGGRACPAPLPPTVAP